MEAWWAEAWSRLETSCRFLLLQSESVRRHVFMNTHFISRKETEVFSKGESLNHIAVCWQHRNKQPSVTDLLCGSSELLLQCLFWSARTASPIGPRRLESLHIQTRWGSWSWCPLYADTRASVWGCCRHGYSWCGPHCSASLYEEKTGETWRRSPDLRKNQQQTMKFRDDLN